MTTKRDLQLGKRIKRLRRQRKLTQEQLAEFVSISPQYLQRLEDGKHQPSISVYSNEIPDHREDLAQESRLRVIKELRKNPNCPISHLKVAAKADILHYRRWGKSVDSKINQTEHPHSYPVTEHPIDKGRLDMFERLLDQLLSRYR